MPLPRECYKCRRKFLPEGRLQSLCKECRNAIRNVNFIKMMCVRTGVKMHQIKIKGGKYVWEKES